MSKKILIVDDSLTVRQQVGAVLGQAGFEVIQACDGVQGVEAVRRHSDLRMVICDINMPRMNGLDMVREVKSDRGKALLPIVMLTTEASPALVAQAKAAGAKGWVVKPFQAEQLLAAVKKLTA